MANNLDDFFAKHDQAVTERQARESEQQKILQERQRKQAQDLQLLKEQSK
jgi:hypothetical protein